MTLEILVTEDREFSQSVHHRKHIFPNQIRLCSRPLQGKKEDKKLGYEENIEVYVNKAKALFYL